MSDEERELSDKTPCEKFANYRIDIVKASGADHALVCQDHLVQLLIPALKIARGAAARVSTLPATSDEPCELGVE